MTQAKEYLTREYLDYIASNEWRQRKLKIIKQRGYRCEACGGADGPLELHHMTYDRLGHECDDDLKLLCVPCHQKADAERIAQTRYANALHTYCSKKYGEYGDCWPDDAEEEFNEWLERKADDGWD